MTTTATSTIALNNGVAMPAIGLGTYPLDDREVAQTVLRATGVGYRLIDTAAKYGNETGVGDGVRACGIPREDLFVTTKLDGGNQGRDRAIPGLDASLRRLRLDYVDLLLIHWPLPWHDLYVDTWRTFEKILATGKTRAIGVSNFKPAHLERLAAGSDLVPAVNQIELNPGVGRVGAREYDAAHGIVTQAWSPLGRGELLSDRGHHRDRGAARPNTGSGDRALARPARRVGGAQVDERGQAGGQHRRFRFRPVRDRHARH